MPTGSGNRRNKKNKTESVWDLLNKPIGFNNVFEVLNKDIGFSNSQGHRIPNLEEQADKLIEDATRLAQSQGISIEQALEKLGIDLDEGGSADSDSGQQVMKESMLKSLSWEVESREEQSDISDADGARDFVRRGNDALNEICRIMGDVDREVVANALMHAQPTDDLLFERLEFVGFITRQSYDALVNRYKTSGGQFWRLLLEDHESDINLFCAVLATMPYMPYCLPEEGALYEWLLDRGLLNFRLFREANGKARKAGVASDRLLVQDEYMGNDRYWESLEEFTGLSQWSKALPRYSAKLLQSVPRIWVDRFELAPVSITKEKLGIAVPYALMPLLKEKLEKEVGLKVVQWLMPSERLEKLRASYLEKAVDAEPPSTKSDTIAQQGRIHDIVASASAVNMVRQLFEGAMESRATDIHIEPHGQETTVRFRIDGLLYNVMTLDEDLYNEVASRIKILADLDITERRRPQDGHIKVHIRDQDYNMRIATIPTKGGEKVSIRMVYAGRVMTKLDDLGLDGKDYEKLNRFVRKPYGMILATGPVGSGKTTTLYSCLNSIDSKIYNVMSVEDPVEFDLPGANQVEVNYKLDFGFAEGLRAILRQDPDTILVGEIRDNETSRIAVRASMTGLLVFSTLHTNDAPGAITALYNFELPTHLIANSVIGVIAQRLVRRICPHCKTSYKPTQKALLEAGFSKTEAQKIKKVYKGKGCEQCFHTGYLDRIGVFEVMEVTSKLRDMILNHASERQLRESAVSEGMRTLSVDGRAKILAGETTIEEYLRMIPH